MRKLALFAFLSLGPAAAFAGPQTLILRDGRTLSGTFVSGNSTSIIFRDDNGVRRRFPLAEIQSIDFTASTSAGLNRSTSGTYPYRASRAQRNAAAGNVRMLSAGTEIAVRTSGGIDSETATEGQLFPAVISQDVTDNTGAVVIPRGSDAQLVIREVREGGVTGSPTLALDLQSVMVNGRRYLVSTEDVSQSSRSGLGANRRTAEMVGGGAALGTLLGAIAGGGRGAVIGALAGAAAGGAVQVLTKGKEVRVPAETELRFRLDQPVELRPVG